jgi:hypothetical protein
LHGEDLAIARFDISRRTIMRTILSAVLALSVLAAVAAPASAGHPDPRNPAVEIPDPSPN